MSILVGGALRDCCFVFQRSYSLCDTYLHCVLCPLCIKAGDAAALAASTGVSVQDVPIAILQAQLRSEGAVVCHVC